MPLYFIAEIQQIKDSTLYQEYIEAVEKIIEKYGGKYLVRGGNSITVSGDWEPIKIIVIEFESIEKMQDCFNSDEYRAIAPLRTKATTGRAIAVEGVET